MIADSLEQNHTFLGRCRLRMVEGSPRRVAVAAHDANVKIPIELGEEDDRTNFRFRHDIPPNPPGSPGGESRWKKLRTTVHLTHAVSHHRKPPLKREDSFLKRFSTRPPNIQPPATHSSTTASTTHQWLCRYTVLNPDESLLFGWLWLVTACGLYNAWTLIAREAFPELQDGVWTALDWTTDVVYCLDVVVQFRTGYLEQGIMVRDGKELAGHYVRSRDFGLDVAALAPLGLLKGVIGESPLLRFPRFLKARRIYKFYYAVESRTAYPNLWRVANLIHVLLLLAHWFGCFYYMLSELEGFQGDWAYKHPGGDRERSPLVRKYLGSVYWSTLTLTTIGDLATPATNLQYLFTIISYLIGVFIFATIVGQVGNVITNRNASRLEFERLLDGAKLYMRHHKVPKGMQRRVQRWYDYSWSRGRMQGGGDIHSALGILPDKLKTELAIHVNLKTLKKVSIFKECQPEFLHDLVLKMKAYIFTPGDLVCRKGEVAREMFIIADGILQVINEKGQVLTHMRAGDFFGEIGILNLDGFNRRTADVRSVGYSELFSLSREDVLSAMKDYPEAEEILQTMGRRRLLEARLTNASEKTSYQDDSESKSENRQRKKGISLTYLLRKKDNQQYDISNFHKQKYSNITIASNKSSDTQPITCQEQPKEEVHQNSTIHFNHVQMKPSESKISSDETTRVTCLVEQITSKFRKRHKTPHFRIRRKHTWWYKISNLVHLRKKTNRPSSSSSKHSEKLRSDEDEPVLLKSEDLKLQDTDFIRPLKTDGKTDSRRTDLKFQDLDFKKAGHIDLKTDFRSSDKSLKDVSSIDDRKTSLQPPSKPSVSNWNRSELFSVETSSSAKQNKNRRKTLADGMLHSSSFAQDKLFSSHEKVPEILMTGSDLNTHDDTPDVSPMSSNYSLTPSTTESEGNDDISEEDRLFLMKEGLRNCSPDHKTSTVQSVPYPELELPAEYRLMISNIVMGIKDKVDALIMETEQKTIDEIVQLKEQIKQQDALIEYLEMRYAKQPGDRVRSAEAGEDESSPTVVHSSPPNTHPEEAASSPEEPSPGDLLSDVKFEEEEMWLVEFPPNLPPSPSKTLERRSRLRRHSSVEVGRPFCLSAPLPPQFLKPQAPRVEHVSPRRFSESQARPDVVHLSSSFAAKVRRVLAKVRVNRESEDQPCEETSPQTAFKWPDPKKEEKKGRRSSTGSTNDRLLSGLFQQKSVPLQPKKCQGSNSDPGDSSGNRNTNATRYGSDGKPTAKRLLPTITESSSFDSLRESPLLVHTSSPLAANTQSSDSEFSVATVVIDMTATGEDFQ